MALSGFEGRLKIVGFEVTTEKGSGAVAHSESWRERVPDFMSSTAISESAHTI